jgi:hypothetical protein
VKILLRQIVSENWSREKILRKRDQEWVMMGYASNDGDGKAMHQHHMQAEEYTKALKELG